MNAPARGGDLAGHLLRNPPLDDRTGRAVDGDGVGVCRAVDDGCAEAPDAVDHHDLAPGVERVARVEHPAGPRLDHPHHADRHRHLLLREPLGAVVEDRPRGEEAPHDFLVAALDIARGDVQAARVLAGETEIPVLPDRAAANGEPGVDCPGRKSGHGVPDRGPDFGRQLGRRDQRPNLDARLLDLRQRLDPHRGETLAHPRHDAGVRHEARERRRGDDETLGHRQREVGGEAAEVGHLAAGKVCRRRGDLRQRQDGGPRQVDPRAAQRDPDLPVYRGVSPDQPRVPPAGEELETLDDAAHTAGEGAEGCRQIGAIEEELARTFLLEVGHRREHGVVLLEQAPERVELPLEVDARRVPRPIRVLPPEEVGEFFHGRGIICPLTGLRR